MTTSSSPVYIYKSEFLNIPANSPLSLRNERFLSLPVTANNRVLGDDYSHKKLETFKVKGATVKNASFVYKSVIAYSQVPKESPKFGLSDELKFGFPYRGIYLQQRIKRNGEIKYHVDLGTVNVGKNFNLFANLKTDLKFGSAWARFGANHFSEKCDSSNRIERSDKGVHFWSNRTVVKEGNFQWSLVGILNLDQMFLTKYDSLLTYRVKDIDFTLQHNSVIPKDNSLQVGKLLGAVTYKLNKQNTLAAQLKRNFADEKARLVVGGQSVVNDQLTVKAKVDQKLKFSASAKYKIDKALTLTVTGQLNLQEGSNAFDFQKWVPIPFGYTLDFAL